MRLRDKLRRRLFISIIEIFPPNFSADDSKEPLIGLAQKTRDLVARVKSVENLADAILVADVKDLSRLKLSSVFAAAILRRELGVEAIPVITARDLNRAALKTMYLTALSYGLDSVMLVWGDRYNGHDGVKNVYDYRSLSEAIRDARRLSERADLNANLLAPVDLSTLDSRQGLSVATSRLSSGADGLLAQPPTSDLSHTLQKHSETLLAHKLDSGVLLNIFPFRSKEDIDACRARFGWNIPKEMDMIAQEGEARLLKEGKLIVERIREQKLSGVFVSTRGRPELARFILD
ncbi:MAG: methylenetetrahydrofolate reductase [Thaumarchaeota archaeon]|nr:methylenetetrahydrofolate reductase [Nitrososphaerota archaeon]